MHAFPYPKNQQTIREVAFSSSNQRGRQIERLLYQDYVERNDARFYKYYQTYRLRQQIIEPIFGIFKRTNRRCSQAIKIRQGMTLGMSCQWDLDYTILKTKEKVLTEYRIAGLAYNLMRLVSEKGLKWVEKRLKKLYFCIFDVRIIHRLSQQQYNEFFSPITIYHMATITVLYHLQNRVLRKLPLYDIK